MPAPDYKGLRQMHQELAMLREWEWERGGRYGGLVGAIQCSGVACLHLTSTVGWRDFEFFGNFKNRQPLIVVGVNSKTKIEKAFFDILRN